MSNGNASRHAPSFTPIAQPRHAPSFTPVAANPAEPGSASTLSAPVDYNPAMDSYAYSQPGEAELQAKQKDDEMQTALNVARTPGKFIDQGSALKNFFMPKTTKDVELENRAKDLPSAGLFTLPSPVEKGVEIARDVMEGGPGMGKAAAEGALAVGGKVSRTGENLMTSAAGLPKQAPGVGSVMSKILGVGTEKGLQAGLEPALGEAGEALGKSVEGIGEIPLQPAIQHIRDTIKGLSPARASDVEKIMPSLSDTDKLAINHGLFDQLSAEGLSSFKKLVPDTEHAKVDTLIGLAKDMQEKYSMSGPMAAGFRSKAGSAAADKNFYSSAADRAAASTRTFQKGTEQAALAKAMQKAPGATPEVQQAYNTYAKLATANKALKNAPEKPSMSATDMLKSFLRPLSSVPAMIGAATGHPLAGAVVGAGLRGVKAAATSAPVKSSLAKALIPAGEAISSPAGQQISGAAGFGAGGLLNALMKKKDETQPARSGEEQK